MSTGAVSIGAVAVGTFGVSTACSGSFRVGSGPDPGSDTATVDASAPGATDGAAHALVAATTDRPTAAPSTRNAGSGAMRSKVARPA